MEDGLNYSFVTELPSEFLAGTHHAFDTEFWPDPRKFTTPHRARCHVFSIACVSAGAPYNPRGFYEPTAWVLPPRCLRQLPADLVLWAHNASVDYHVATNHGVNLNIRDTLSLSRALLPSRAGGDGYTLDALGMSILGVGKTDSYKILMSQPVVARKIIKGAAVCSCGADKCRRRGPSHTRTKPDREAWVELKRREEIPLDSVKPGHSKWEDLVRYSARDAWVTSGLVQKLQKMSPK